MAKDKNRGNREAKKPKKAKVKTAMTSSLAAQSATSQVFGRANAPKARK